MELRPYQSDIINRIYAEWNRGAKNVMVQLATGGGKTVTFCKIAKDWKSHSVINAHRVEIVSQISLTLARYGIRHNLIAQRSPIREIVSLHIKEVGASYYDPRARCAVSCVDTLIRLDPSLPLFQRTELLIQDEAHHVLRDNKWGKAAALFPNARGLYVTATPCRADGRGLGRGSDGIMDALIIGPTMRDLIMAGYLSDYDIKAPLSDIDLSGVKIAASGDYSPQQLREAVHKSHIVGDVVEQYIRCAMGKLGITFAVDIESATDIADRYRQQGVKAEVISSKTPTLLRADIMRRFRNREILQLVNVDLLGEGVDVPAVEVVSMARPTESFSLYSQQFGRALRPSPGKPRALILDHVNNVIRHKLPERAASFWSLDPRDKRSKSQETTIPLTVCRNPACLAPYERCYSVCPHCGHKPEPRPRGTPEEVDGDLTEFSQEFMDKMLAEIYGIQAPPPLLSHLTGIAQAGARKKHNERQMAQEELLRNTALWAGYYHAQGEGDSVLSRRFYYTFGVDIMTAQTLGRPDAEELTKKVKKVIDLLVNSGVQFATT